LPDQVRLHAINRISASLEQPETVRILDK
jgi:hypothetical protein